MTVFCPFCARTLIPQAAPRLRREPVSCHDCELRWEVSTWPELPGVMGAGATLRVVENVVPWPRK